MFYKLNDKNIAISEQSEKGRGIIETDSVLNLSEINEYDHFNKKFNVLKWRVRFDLNGDQVGSCFSLKGFEDIESEFFDAPEGYDQNSKDEKSRTVNEDGVVRLMNNEEFEEYSLYISSLRNRKKHFIRSITLPSESGKDLFSINYKKDLLPGIRLEDENIFSDHGSIQKTNYYHGEDENKKLVLVVSEEYQYHSEDLIEDENHIDYVNPSQKRAVSRTKKWNYAFEDGTLDEELTNLRPKKYNTNRKSIKEGQRRRKNIIFTYSYNVGLAGILSGIFSSSKDANKKMKELHAKHSAPMNEWEDFGSELIYLELENDSTTSWLDTIVVDTAQTQYMCPWMIGLTLREYSITKLKGKTK
jgi:hypothetical protein